MHHVALALYPGFQVLNLAVSTVLEFANRSLGEPLYQVHLLSEHGGPVLSSGGFSSAPSRSAGAASIPCWWWETTTCCPRRPRW